MSEQYEQMPFPGEGVGSVLQPDSSLSDAVPFFVKRIQYDGLSENTVKAFVSDLRLVAKYAGDDMVIGEFSTKSLQEFLHWMLHERGVPCSPKTYARRLTTLKVFFRWLHQSGILDHDPAESIIHEPVSSPMPVILHDEEAERLLAASDALRAAEKPDTRPHLLVNLLLQTGLKKGEIMALRPDSFDASEPDAPTLWVRYDNPRTRYKERKLFIDPLILPILDEYLAQYQPPDAIFNCTPRNLEYILRNVALAAGIDKKVSFEVLRWTSSVRAFRGGMDAERLRQKMGLSRVSWRETGAKIARLAEEAL